MATSMYEILYDFSFWYESRCINSESPRSHYMTLNLELEQMNISNRHCQSDFAHSFEFYCLTDFAQDLLCKSDRLIPLW